MLRLRSPGSPPSSSFPKTFLPRSRSRSVARDFKTGAWYVGVLVKIYTKTGDAGETGLFGGGRVPKDDPRVQAYGHVDELNATLGFAAALEPSDFESESLQSIQRDLFLIGAELATPDAAKVRDTVSTDRVAAIEQLIDKHEAELAPLKNFILPGGAPKAA